jgi:hypothetical protein
MHGTKIAIILITQKRGKEEKVSYVKKKKEIEVHCGMPSISFPSLNPSIKFRILLKVAIIHIPKHGKLI